MTWQPYPLAAAVAALFLSGCCFCGDKAKTGDGGPKTDPVAETPPPVVEPTLPPPLNKPVDKVTLEATWPKPEPAKVGEPALGGVCLVTMVKDQKWAAGKEPFVTPVKEQKFLSRDGDRQKEFAADPVKYLPVTGAYCAYCWVDLKRKVPAQPQLFSVYKGRLYMFGATAGKKAFDADPERYVKALAEAD